MTHWYLVLTARKNERASLASLASLACTAKATSFFDNVCVKVFYFIILLHISR